MRHHPVIAAAALLAALVTAPGGVVSGHPSPFTRGDLRWLGRVTFGVDSTAVASYRRLGRQKFLEEQLHPPSDDPAVLHGAIAALGIEQTSAETRIRGLRQEQQRINAL